MAANLPHKVECRRSTYQFFELIAAFNTQRAAETYAAECAETNRQFEYRVVSGRSVTNFPSTGVRRRA